MIYFVSRAARTQALSSCFLRRRRSSARHVFSAVWWRASPRSATSPSLLHQSEQTIVCRVLFLHCHDGVVVAGHVFLKATTLLVPLYYATWRASSSFGLPPLLQHPFRYRRQKPRSGRRRFRRVRPRRRLLRWPPRRRQQQLLQLHLFLLSCSSRRLLLSSAPQRRFVSTLYVSKKRDLKG